MVEQQLDFIDVPIGFSAQPRLKLVDLVSSPDIRKSPKHKKRKRTIRKERSVQPKLGPEAEILISKGLMGTIHKDTGILAYSKRNHYYQWVKLLEDVHAEKLIGYKIKGLSVFKIKQSVEVFKNGYIWSLKDGVGIGAYAKSFHKMKFNGALRSQGVSHQRES